MMVNALKNPTDVYLSEGSGWEAGNTFKQGVGKLSLKGQHLNSNLSGNKGPVTGTCQGTALQAGDPLV